MTTRDRINLLQQNRIEEHVIAAILGMSEADVSHTLRDPTFTPPDPEAAPAATGQRLIIPTEESLATNTFDLMPTPDELTITLGADGLFGIAYQAKWKQSFDSPAGAAFFLDGVEMPRRWGPAGNFDPINQRAGQAITNIFTPLLTFPEGLRSSENTEVSAPDLTTGQLIGYGPGGGPALAFAAAGEHVLSVRFQAWNFEGEEGVVTVKERKLWAWVVA